ncbi:MAG: hypothetical protein HY870_15825, partial [Chloroflexi bacterium]|nr:hypothetical protein [Chloroflexota bacterium]
MVPPLKSREELFRVTPLISSTVTLYQYWSPSGQHFTIDGEQDGQYHGMTTFSTIYTAKQDKSAVIHFSYKWGGIRGWTTDGRYALFGSGDQYGNSAAYAFDTREWAELGLGFSSRYNCGIGSACRQGIVTIAPKTSRLVLGDGNLVNLTDLSHTNVISDIGRNSIGLAAWSPDESYVIFTAYQYKDDHTNDFALFLAKGDGTQVRQLSSMETSANSIGWGIGGQCASITTDKE